MGKTEKRIKLGATALCELFTGYTLIMLLTAGEPDRLALAFGTLLLAALPLALEKLLSCRISLPLYLFALAYAIGPMLGHCWKLYYTVPVWDKLLHISGGVVFAVLGAYLFDRMMGLAIRIPDETGFARLNTPMRLANQPCRTSILRMCLPGKNGQQL